MSGLPTSYDSPSRPFTGVQRSSSNARLHNLQRPYSRPLIASANTNTNGDNVEGSGSGHASRGLALTTRPSGIPASGSTTSLPRSGSESSLGLIGGIKSIFSRPLAWLATPSRATAKRDIGDEEDPDSPLHENRSKKSRRRSPSPSHRGHHQNHYADGQNGDYAPKEFQVQGRAITANMIKPTSSSSVIPPLPPNLSLTARKPSNPPTNFSRPLANSKSMPYLDPPSSTLSPSRPPKRSGMLTRSRRMDLASEAGDDEDDEMDDHRKGDSDWAPAPSHARQQWGGRSAVPASPGRPSTPSRKTPSKDFTLPSNSPFKIPVSPSASRHISGGSLSRSNTIANIARAPSVAATDISMDNESSRSVRRSGSLLFGSSRGRLANGDREDRMSVDSGREGSVTDWFMKDRWDGSIQSRRAPSMRPGSIGPSSGLPPIRRGQLVWDSEKGFVRESELRAAEPAPSASNEAERILFALENRRSTPLQTARSSVPFSQGGPFPADLVGASTRQIRKAINVPLATSQATETLASKREREIQEERSRGVSVLISPYGRRRQADDAVREARRQRSVQRDPDYRPDSSRQLSVDDNMSVGSRSSRAHSDQSMRSDSEAEAHPSATPRRSSRLRRTDATPEPETTPKARRTKGKAPSSSTKSKSQAQTTTPKETPRRSSRKRTVERATSPTPPAAIPSLPVITETAPSPQQDKQREATSTSGYRPLADGGLERGTSSLRAGAEKKSRTHQSASNSRANTPGSGRYSAREEDLPDMDELEQPKIPFNSFSGITFSGLSSGTSTPAAQPSSSEKAPSSASPEASLLGRLGPVPPPATGKDQSSSSSSLGVPRAGGPLSRLNASRPRASSPLASGSIVAQPESPPTQRAPSKSPQHAPASLPVAVPNTDGFVPLFGAGSGSTTPAAKPPSTPFGGFGANKPTSGSALFGTVDGPKKSLGFGIGKPSSAPESTSTTTKGEDSAASIPDFFSGSKPPSGTSTPVTSVPTFNFGVSAPPPTAVKPAEPVSNGGSGFSFSAPSAATTNGDKSSEKPLFSFGAKPAETAPAATPSLSSASSSGFSFGSSKPAETTKAAEPVKSPFAFGQPASSPAADAAPKTDKPAFGGFNFSQPAPTATASTEAPKEKTPFSFGQPAKKEEPAKSTFSFGSTSIPPPPSTNGGDTAPKSTFSFGQPAQNASTGASAPPTFGAASSTSASAAPASTGFGFSFAKPAESPKAGAGAAASSPASTFSFGAGNASSGFGASSGAQANGNKRGPPESSNEPPPKYSSTGTGSATASTPSFSFGAPSQPPQANGSTGLGITNGAASSPGFGGFGSSAPAAQSSSNPFGSSSTPAFNFGQSNPTTPTATPVSNPFGSTPSAGAGPATTTPGNTGFNFTFGGGSAPPPATQSSTSSPFQFGSSGAPPAFGAGGNDGGALAPATPTFGGFATSTTPAQTPTTFSFGAGAPGATTTPQGTPSFAFGAGAGGPPAQQQPRFGSPAPPASPAGDGFSLGAAGPVGGTPGSPGGRRIKPLRKTAAKR